VEKPTPISIKLPLPQGPISLLGFGDGIQMARERWGSISGTKKLLTTNLHK